MQEDSLVIEEGGRHAYSKEYLALTFTGTDIENLAGNVATSTHKFTLANGKVELKAVETPSKTMSDKISLPIQQQKNQV